MRTSPNPVRAPGTARSTSLRLRPLQVLDGVPKIEEPGPGLSTQRPGRVSLPTHWLRMPQDGGKA